MVGTTEKGLRRSIRELVRSGTVRRAAVGALIVAHDLTDPETDALRAYIRTLGVEMVGPLYL